MFNTLSLIGVPELIKAFHDISFHQFIMIENHSIIEKHVRVVIMNYLPKWD